MTFLTGLLVRSVQFIANRNPGSLRERATRERALRLRVRRPAEGVPPAGNRRDFPDDSDPALDLPEWDR